MFCCDTCCFKGGAVDGVDVIGALCVYVVGVTADESSDEAGGVGNVAIEHGFPSSLCYLVYFLRVARHGSGEVAVVAVKVTFEGSERFGMLAVEDVAKCAVGGLAVGKCALEALVAEMFLTF